MPVVKGKLNRACNRKGRSGSRASRIEDRALRGTFRHDRARKARAEHAAWLRAVNAEEREHHTNDGRITVWRRE